MQSEPQRRRVALVTGAGRSMGIGAAICRALAADGLDIFFTYWRPYDRSTSSGAEEDWQVTLEEEMARTGIRCAAMEADLSRVDTPSRVLDAAEATLGMPSVLVNNAAYSATGGYDRLDATSLDAHYAVNVRGTLLLSVEFARRWTGGAGGRIINMTSGQSRGPMPGELAYVASKGAVEAATISLAAEVAALGITVNAVDPGPTDTGWMSDQVKRDLLHSAPQGRLGQPEDAARLVAFLAGEASGWITGQVIRSDGGVR